MSGLIFQIILFLILFSVGWTFGRHIEQKHLRELDEKEKEFEASLKIGDKIVTKSGLHGKVAELAETTVVIETMSGKLKMERSAISMEMSAALAKK